jgi:hypothetical protein
VIKMKVGHLKLELLKMKLKISSHWLNIEVDVTTTIAMVGKIELWFQKLTMQIITKSCSVFWLKPGLGNYMMNC